ncbi:MAG: hypothetical protein K9K88_05015 [Desulfobacterales bacterium]|nr:hypothetical protein [Desulfobacterales bacterium]
MIRTKLKNEPRVCQGDVLCNIECVETVYEKEGIIEVSKISFPLVVVLTQDCDLSQDYTFRTEKKPTKDKLLISVLLAPIYNAEHVFRGEHLSDLGINSAPINKKKSPGKTLVQNKNPRYHFIEFPPDLRLVPSIIDFKHYFSVNIAYLEFIINDNFVCSISELYREALSQRFASFLSRIGLPND